MASATCSVLGHLPNEPQPSQKMFETLVLARLRSFDLASGKLGRLPIGE